MLGDDELGMLTSTLYIARGEERAPEYIKKVEELLVLTTELYGQSNSI